ncbi:hypothetical protein HK098_006236 [Nowakowskiella sp. JEL0407]|nr:hypothetical protein HK098_006236 [Nowakowskiella sp. JEL0407]
MYRRFGISHHAPLCESKFRFIVSLMLKQLRALSTLKEFSIDGLDKTNLGLVGDLKRNNQLEDLTLCFAGIGIKNAVELNHPLLHWFASLKDHQSLGRVRLHSPENERAEDFLYACLKAEDGKKFELDYFFLYTSCENNEHVCLVFKLLPEVNPRVFELHHEYLLVVFNETTSLKLCEYLMTCCRLERLPLVDLATNSNAASENFGKLLAKNTSIRELDLNLSVAFTKNQIQELASLVGTNRTLQLIKAIMKLPYVKHLRISSDYSHPFHLLWLADVIIDKALDHPLRKLDFA